MKIDEGYLRMLSAWSKRVNAIKPPQPISEKRRAELREQYLKRLEKKESKYNNSKE